ncbi:MAG: hypothetical protein K1X66_08645 [Verrucomicrobiae bacterium]|nr:hypothetical protein [Verrucomicrobiae bacterium]
MSIGLSIQAAILKLSQPVPPNSSVVSAEFALNNTHVVYTLETNFLGQIYSVPVTGGNPISLTQFPPGVFLNAVRVSPDGTRVFYIANATSPTRFDLYSVPVDGNSLPVQVSSISVNGGAVRDYQVTKDGSQVFYIADELSLGQVRLFQAQTTQFGTSAIININGLLPTSDIDSFELTPDEANIIFEADPVLLNNNEILKVSVQGGATVSLSGPPAAGGGNSTTTFLKVSPNGSRVAFRMDRDNKTTNELYSVPINGTAADVIKLNAPLEQDEDVAFGRIRFSADGNRILYLSQEAIGDNHRDLYYVGAANPADKRRINPLFSDISQQVLDFAWNKKGDRIIYSADQQQPSVFRLYSSRVNGGPITSLNDAFIVNGFVLNFQVVPNGKAVLYVANKQNALKRELYFVPIRGGENIKLSDEFSYTPGFTAGVSIYAMSSDSKYVAYVSQQEDETKAELYITEIPIVRDATADFDGDKVNDILLKKGRSLRILTRNNPTNTFQFKDFLTLMPKKHKILAAKDLNADDLPEIIFKKGKKPPFALTVTTNLLLTNTGVQLPTLAKKFKIRASGYIDTNTVLVATKRKIMRLYYTPFNVSTNNTNVVVNTNNFIERANPKGFKVVGFGSFNEEPAIFLRGAKKQKKQFSAIAVVNTESNGFAFGTITTNVGTLPKKFKPFAAAPYVEEINSDVDVVIRKGKTIQLLDLLPTGSTNTYPVKTLFKKEKKYKIVGPK